METKLHSADRRTEGIMHYHMRLLQFTSQLIGNGRSNLPIVFESAGAAIVNLCWPMDLGALKARPPLAASISRLPPRMIQHRDREVCEHPGRSPAK